MSALVVRVAGIGLWGPALAGWPASLAALRGEVPADLSTSQKPSPPLLPPAERRRAPETVLFAAQAAAEACAAAGLAPGALPAVFGSAQGDIAITDYMCATLATAPLELSPTKFHNSVHNAAVGYWTIATGCRAASTALSAWADTVGASLLEAALQAHDTQAPVLVAVYDSAAVGPMAAPIHHDCGFAFALVVDVDDPAVTGPRLVLEPVDGDDATEPDAAWARELRDRNSSAVVLPLLEALAGTVERRVRLRAGPGFMLDVRVRP